MPWSGVSNAPPSQPPEPPLSAPAPALTTPPHPAGLLRFLDLVARHPWHRRPLVVDPDRQLSEDDHRAICRRFEERRAAGTAGAAGALPGAVAPAPALYICTPRDRESSNW